MQNPDQEICDKIANEAVVVPVEDRSQDTTFRSRSAGSERLDGDASKGDVLEYYHYDETEKTFTHELVEDVEPALKLAQRLRLEHGNNVGKNKAGDFYLAGSFPLVIVHAWLKRVGLKMPDFKGKVVNEFLNDPEHTAFRIWPGRV